MRQKCCDLSSDLSRHSGSQTFSKYKSIKSGRKKSKNGVWCTANSKDHPPPPAPNVNEDTTILKSVHLQTFCIGWQRITSDFSYQLSQTFRKYKSIKPGSKKKTKNGVLLIVKSSPTPPPPPPPPLNINGDTTIPMLVHLQTFCIGWQRITSNFSYQLAKNSSFVLKT